MKTSDVYNRFILKSEKNGTNDNVSTSKERFVELYNEYQIRYAEFIIGNKNTDTIRYVESILVKDRLLKDPVKNKEYYSFKLPENYLDLSSAYALGSKGKCRNKKINLFIESMKDDKDLYLSDSFTEPSFEFRESLFDLSSGMINIYYTDFELDSASVSYYRYPNKITLINPENPESDFDDTVEIDFDEKAINKIITASVSGFDMNNDSQRWKLNNLFAKKDL